MIQYDTLIEMLKISINTKLLLLFYFDLFKKYLLIILQIYYRILILVHLYRNSIVYNKKKSLNPKKMDKYTMLLPNNLLFLT